MTQSTIRSSLALELLLYVNARFSILFYLFIVGAFIYKLALMPYSLHVAICEAVIVVLFGPIELIRIHWARRGNLLEMPVPLVLSLLLSIGAASTCIYLTLFQAYMNAVEKWAAFVELGLLAVEAGLEIFAIVTFSMKRAT